MEYRVKEGYSNYRIYSNGQIYSLNIHKWLTPSLKEYYRVSLRDDNGRAKTFAVHRLVAELFIPNPNNYPIVNHKDENKLNNDVSNLEWCTYSYNSKYSSHAVTKSITMCDKETHEPIKTFPSRKAALEFLGITRGGGGQFTKVFKGERKSYLGYWWQEG